MTIAEIRESVRGKLDDSQYDATIIDEAINWFQNELFSNTRTRLMEESDNIAVATNATTADFPDDMQLLLNLSITSPTPAQRIMDGYVAYDEFVSRYPNFASATAARIRYWTDYGNGLRFSAPADQSHTLFVEYLRRPTLMEDDGDESEVPDAYRELMTLGALARVMERNEDYSEAAQERLNLEPLMTTFIRNEGRGQLRRGPVVMRTNRRGRGNLEF